MSSNEPSKATLLVNLVIDAKIPLFHTPEQETYAELLVDGHHEIWPLRSQQFQYWMDRQFFWAHREGAGKHALQDALLTLHAHALYDGHQRNVYLRMAEEQGDIYLDLCDAEWRAVRISQTGWEVLRQSP